jgi:hypothetical protein
MVIAKMELPIVGGASLQVEVDVYRRTTVNYKGFDENAARFRLSKPEIKELLSFLKKAVLEEEDLI